MARTTFSGPVRSDNGFEGNMVSGTVSASAVSATVLTSASATITNLIATSATINNVRVSNANAASGAVSAQLGFIPVLVGSTTAYIALYQSVTV
jgi:predicted permease